MIKLIGGEIGQQIPVFSRGGPMVPQPFSFRLGHVLPAKRVFGRETRTLQLINFVREALCQGGVAPLFRDLTREGHNKSNAVLAIPHFGVPR